MTDLSFFDLAPQDDSQKQAFRADLVAVADPFTASHAYGNRSALDLLGAAVVGTERAHEAFDVSCEEAFADLSALLPRALKLANTAPKMRLVQQCHAALTSYVDAIASFWEDLDRSQDAA